MKKFVNRNFFWSEVFVEQIRELGVKHVCISPGSRNTPLTLAFAGNNKIKKTIHVDERSAAFFALGVAKNTKLPVAIVTTSGTAVAELFPAIIEAYVQRVPLIVCTADRPDWLRDTGANQTINQENIFKNHIRAFIDVGLPELTKSKLKSFTKNVTKLIEIATITNPGPIQINFPFIKPLEPSTFTEKVDCSIDEFIVKFSANEKLTKPKISRELIKKINKSKRPLIYCGWDERDYTYENTLLKFVKKFALPVIADGTSSLRFSNEVISNHNCFLPFISEQPDLIIQFGNAPTSQVMLSYFEKNSSIRYIINQYGDMKDPSRTKGKLLKVSSLEFINTLENDLERKPHWKEWKNKLLELNSHCEKNKRKLLKTELKIEPNVVSKVVDLLPNKSNVFISNSMPIRDFDLFASAEKKALRVFTNRGASGIDGIISTASGIAYTSNSKSILIIGDLAFYHNISALSTLSELNIPLIILLINNNGGGIFNMLPVANEKSNFEKYFTTPQNLNYKKIINAFGLNYYQIRNVKKFEEVFHSCLLRKTPTVIEIKTSIVKSVKFRKDYLSSCKEFSNVD